MINVTKSSLPDLDEYIEYLKGIWMRYQLTNSGPLVLELEERLKKYLSAPYLHYVSNGTIALQIALKALNISGEVITTPFSYVATTASIVWEGCTPVFVDIDKNTLTIDPELIAAAITERTQAIMATHVYGNPCDVVEIAKIAEKYQLKVIYDAAHSFGVKYREIPLTNYGDISTISHHATKLFHTVEGGSIVCQDELLAHKIAYLRNFGHNGSEAFYGVGINGKNSEFHAAMGLCLLPNVARNIHKRRLLSECYDNYLLQDEHFKRPTIREETDYNYSYYPLLFESETTLLNAVKILNQRNIFPRRYFYPALTTLNYVNASDCPITEEMARRVLCLPLYEDLSEEMVVQIAQIILNSIKLSIAV